LIALFANARQHLDRSIAHSLEAHTREFTKRGLRVDPATIIVSPLAERS
jgi:hypothetical protein